MTATYAFHDSGDPEKYPYVVTGTHNSWRVTETEALRMLANPALYADRFKVEHYPLAVTK